MDFECDNCGCKYFTVMEMDVEDVTYHFKEKGKERFLVCGNCGHMFNEELYNRRLKRLKEEKAKGYL